MTDSRAFELSEGEGGASVSELGDAAGALYALIGGGLPVAQTIVIPAPLGATSWHAEGERLAQEATTAIVAVAGRSATGMLVTASGRGPTGLRPRRFSLDSGITATEHALHAYLATLSRGDPMRRVRSLLVQSIHDGPRARSGMAWTRHPTLDDRTPFGFVRLGSTWPIPLASAATALRECAEEWAIVNGWSPALERIFGRRMGVRFASGAEDGHALHILSAFTTWSDHLIAAKVLIGLVDAGALSWDDAVAAYDPALPCEGSWDLDGTGMRAVAKGGGGGRGVAVGRLVASDEALIRLSDAGEPVVLARAECNPRDSHLLMRVVGLVTAVGGPSSHLAVLASGLGKTVVTGVGKVEADQAATGSSVVFSGTTLSEGAWVTIDGRNGIVYEGRASVSPGVRSRDEARLLEAASARCSVDVLVNADSTASVSEAVANGAQGVGLCRSEAQLDAPELRTALVTALLGSPQHRRVAWDGITEHLKGQLKDMLRAVNGGRFFYRLLDIRRREFLPLNASEVLLLCGQNGISLEEWHRWVEGAHASWTDGMRGVRLGLDRPWIYERQLQFIVDVLLELVEEGVPCDVTVVVPFVTVASEVGAVRTLLEECSSGVGLVTERIEGCSLRLGAMLETPRAAAAIEGIAAQIAVLCLGTNDLTEALWCMDRDESPTVLATFRAGGFVGADPFQVLDADGLRPLLAVGLRKAIEVNPSIEICACGQQAGEVSALGWLREHQVGTVSVGSAQLAYTRLASAIADARGRSLLGAGLSAPDAMRAHTAQALNEVSALMFRRRPIVARQRIEAWAAEITRALGIRSRPVWKLVKREIVASWFGERRRLVLEPGWDAQTVADFAVTLAPGVIRCSLFSPEIASHSSTSILPTDDMDALLTALGSLDQSTAGEVFRQEDLDRLCWRAVCRADSQDLSVEAGIGQAMYVFELARGSTPVLRGRVDSRGTYLLGSTGEGPMTPLDALLSGFLERFGAQTLLKALALASEIGVEWLAVEGYYGPYDQQPMVCDLDLPFDVAFNYSVESGNTSPNT